MKTSVILYIDRIGEGSSHKAAPRRIFSRCFAVRFFLSVCFVVFISSLFPTQAHAEESVRKERVLIRKGNSLYNGKKYREAARLYEEALQANPESAVGRFNLGMSQLRQGLVQDTTRQTQEALEAGVRNLSTVAALGMKNPKVASLASFNLGNLSFGKEDYDGAINYYKQALRINPDDNYARRNLRIAQLRKQNQDNKDKDKNQDKNQDQQQNQDQNKEQNKDQNQDQNKDQNQDKNKDRNQNQDRNNQQKNNEKDISQQTADQILRAVENKENQVRNRVMRGQGSGQGKEQAGSRGGRRNW